MNEEHENSKYLNLALKLRDLSDLNDLYSYQDVSILCQIFENHFKMIHRTNGYVILGYVI